MNEPIFDMHGENEKYSGCVIINNVLNTFHFQKTKEGNYVYRGSLSVRSPKDGSVLSKTKDGTEHKITKELNFNDFSKAEEYIINRAKKIYEENELLIVKKQGLTVTQEIIWPSMAVTQYARKFVDVTCFSRNPKKKERRVRTLHKLAGFFENTPMKDVSPAMVKKIIKKNKISETSQKLLYDFWAYCCAQQYCSGNNPVPAIEKHGCSVETLTKKALTPDVLSQAQQDAIYRQLNANVCGLACAVALVMSGWSIEFILKLKWKDVIFSSFLEDYVRIIYTRPELSSATHDYTRPCVPQTAMILQKQYQYLKTLYPEEKLRNYPVAAGHDNISVVNRDAVTGWMRTLLRSREVTCQLIDDKNRPTSIRIYHNTYANNLGMKCNLKEDHGTLSFLLGQNLNSTTDDHYVSYTCEEAQKRMYYILSCLKEAKKNERTEITKEVDENTVIHTLLPEMPDRCVVGKVIIKLKPGEKISLNCPCGVEFRAVARKINQDGKKCRITKKDKAQ